MEKKVTFRIKIVRVAVILVLLMTGFMAYSTYTFAKLVKHRCSDFDTWQAAQDFFMSNPVKNANLDRGGIPGKACESLQKKKPK